jgi:hypothetical protein
MTKDLNEWIYNVSKGQLIDVPNEFGEQLVERNLAVAVDQEKAIKETYGLENAAAPTPTKSTGKRGKRDPQADEQTDGNANIFG